MNITRLLATHRTSLSSLALALLLIAPVASTAATELSAPPAYPDSTHVPNGCHLSTVSYLNRFLAQYPNESGQPLVIAMHNDAGVHWNHTIALISWHGETWCRDEYLGVFALGCQVDAQPNLKHLGNKAETLLNRQAQMLIRSSGSCPLVPPPDVLTAEQRIQDVTAAVRMIPFPATIFWVRSGKHEVPVAFFRPSAQQIAVYEPLHGTCLAECAIHSDAKVVSLVAAKLGYSAEGVHADTSLPQATLVADASR